MNAYRGQEQQQGQVQQQRQQQQQVPMFNNRNNKLQHSNSKFQRLVERELRYGYLDRPVPSQDVPMSRRVQGPLGAESSVRGKKCDIEVSVVSFFQHPILLEQRLMSSNTQSQIAWEKNVAIRRENAVLPGTVRRRSRTQAWEPG